MNRLAILQCLHGCERLGANDRGFIHTQTGGSQLLLGNAPRGVFAFEAETG